MKISYDELSREVMTALTSNGMPESDASAVCEEIVFAEARGKGSHGLNMLSTMIKRQAKPHSEPRILDEGSSWCFIDGGGKVGPVVARRAMDIAIKKARENGIAVVAVKTPSPFLTAGFNAWRAAKDHGMVALNLSVAKSKVAPHGTTVPILGTNPIGFAFPADPYPVVLDMAITKIPAAEVKIAQAEGHKLPADVAFDSQGKTTLDPFEAEKGALIPFGGYKGSALGVVVELLCGALLEAKCGLRAGEMRSMLFIAIKADLFAELGSVKKLARQLREDVAENSGDPQKPARLPGDAAEHMFQKALQDGLNVAEEAIVKLRGLCS